MQRGEGASQQSTADTPFQLRWVQARAQPGATRPHLSTFEQVMWVLSGWQFNTCHSHAAATGTRCCPQALQPDLGVCRHSWQNRHKSVMRCVSGTK
jgi:hypothetical protein